MSQTARSITEENLPESLTTEHPSLPAFDALNAKAILDGIMEKFKYSQEKAKYEEFIRKDQFKLFPNPALQSRRIEKEIT